MNESTQDEREETPDAATLRDWLLHRLPEAKLAALEVQLLREDALLSRLQEAEYDLLDDYVAGALPADARADVQRHLLGTAEAQRKLRVARALHGHRQRSEKTNGKTVPTRASKTIRPTRRRRWALLTATAALAAIVLVVRLAPVVSHPPPATARVGNREFTVALLDRQLRGAATETIPLFVPGDTARLRLQAQIPDSAPAGPYRLLILDARGRMAVSAEALSVVQSGGLRYVEALVPAADLTVGPFRVRLSAAGATATLREWPLDLHFDRG